MSRRAAICASKSDIEADDEDDATVSDDEAVAVVRGAEGNLLMISARQIVPK